VPQGSGQFPIAMSGTWMLANARLVDTNDPTASPPINGTEVVLASDGLLMVDGEYITRPVVEADLGFPVDWYINQADGKTLLWGFGYDHLSMGGERFQAGLAGGAVDPNLIEVETYASLKGSVSDPELYARARYQLRRISNAITGFATIPGEATGDDPWQKLTGLVRQSEEQLAPRKGAPK